jgi:dTDP-4-dehydrorhamnose reductase
MKILVTGAGGMLGHAMSGALSPVFPSANITLAARADMDITDGSQVQRFFSSIQPDVLINCAAFTKVDLAEKESLISFAVNAFGPGTLAEACAKSGVRMVHFSTDYVFNGAKTGPYNEKDMVNPISHYGGTKLEGERRALKALPRVLIIRTSWLFGPGGPNFVKTMISKGKELGKLKVVNDQTGAPTYTPDLATATARLIEAEASGIVNVTNSGACSWYEFAVEIMRLAGLPGVGVTPIPTSAYRTPAKRPKNSLLDNSRYVSFTGRPLRHWREALAEYISMGEGGL